MLYLARDRYVGRSLDLYGEYSEFEVRLFAQFLQPGMSVAEIGANLGALTIPLAKLVGPSGAVLALEPQRAMFYLLCANLALNEQFHVRAYRAAMGASAGTVQVPLIDHRREENFGGIGLSDPRPGEGVAMITLDGLDLPALHLLKVDVEGMEADVLRGAAATIVRHRPILYVENDRPQSSAQVIALIDSFGYDAYWHLPPLYNTENFFGLADNVFGGIISINLLCVPREKGIVVQQMRRVTGPDDWWQKSG